MNVELENPSDGSIRRAIELLADTGALYSLIPRKILDELRVKPVERQEFELADGRIVERDIGEVRVRFDGRQRLSTVIFGEEGDSALLGVVTMEEFGLEVDPVCKQLRLTRMILY